MRERRYRKITSRRLKRRSKMLTGEGVGKGHDEALLAHFSPFARTKSCTQLGDTEQADFLTTQRYRITLPLIFPHCKHQSIFRNPNISYADLVVAWGRSVFYPAAEYQIDAYYPDCRRAVQDRRQSLGIIRLAGDMGRKGRKVKKETSSRSGPK